MFGGLGFLGFRFFGGLGFRVLFFSFTVEDLGLLGGLTGVSREQGKMIPIFPC